MLESEMYKARVIAFYLPQFHPIPENDQWWGKGFTEWTNVGKAKPLFRGHYQPRVPRDLGYYDLRLPEVRIAQARMAKEHGVEGFCYWHYWFGNGKRLLERPFNEVLKSKEPDFPFCLGWANETWSGIWHGDDKRILVEQKYPGKVDYEAHFYEVLKAFNDERYIKVEGKPLFYIYRPALIPDISLFVDTWRFLAQKNGLNGIYFVGSCLQFEGKNEIAALGLDAININRLFDIRRQTKSRIQRGIEYRLFKKTNIFEYKKAMKFFISDDEKELNFFPNLYPNWDNSPRSGKRAYILTNSTPELFELHIQSVLKTIIHKPYDNRIVFLKSWNEWAEGNYVEPDLKYGMAYLEKLKSNIISF